jgi:hypothetical protein
MVGRGLQRFSGRTGNVAQRQEPLRGGEMLASAQVNDSAGPDQTHELLCQHGLAGAGFTRYGNYSPSSRDCKFERLP